MSEHKIEIQWKLQTTDFGYETYDRTHEVTFAGGQKVTSSAATEFFGKAEWANPEELLAAAAATCHMLTFLAICARSHIVVNRYEDKAVATLNKSEQGKMAVTKITLSPRISFEGSTPEPEKLKALHEKSHANCFIANSLKYPVEILPL